MMQKIIKPFIFIMDYCYSVCNNYGLAIILFTLLSKIILFPLSIWVQNNSIKMVKMQPDLYFVKSKYFGDKERIAEEESKIYKEYKYNPGVSIIPTFVQLILLIGVIEAIKSGINNGVYDMSFLGFSLAAIPSKVFGIYIIIPFMAALSAFAMCMFQNKSNVIQAEQSKTSQLITLSISVGLSLYLGFFVSSGVAIYWIFSNLFAIFQLFLLNLMINPEKYVDYEKLEESKKTLAELESVGKRDNNLRKTEYKKREREDYTRFFSVVNKHVVFYSESNGFFKYFRGLIEYLLDKTNITIHYITSDPEDNIFNMANENKRIRAYYIGEKRLITLMMKMDADIVLMTIPDLENYHIKRSYVRKDVEYIFVDHGLGSVNITFKKEGLDHFDTIFCPDLTQKEEILARERIYNLKPKNLVECGYFLLDDMHKEYDTMRNHNDNYILLAPSYHEGNIVDSCLDELLGYLSVSKYKIIVRPHPQQVRHKREWLETLKEKYERQNDNIKFQLDFSSTDTVWKAALLITDWSDISFEYAFCTHKPILFVNTPMKVMNPEYKRLGIVPINVEMRNIAGKCVELDELDKSVKIIDNLLINKEKYANDIAEFEKKQVYNLGVSASVGGKYIVERLIERKNKKNE